MSEFLSRQFTFSITGLGIAGGIFLAIICLALILIYVNRLQGKLHSYEKPNYGFLGKPIYPIAATFLVTALVLFSSVKFDTQKTIDVKADTQFDVEVSQSVLSTAGDTATVALSAMPIVEGKEWGDEGDVFDIYWNIRGAENIDRYEFIVTKSNPSGLELTLPKGSYNINFTIVYRGRSFVVTKPLTI